MQRIITVLVCWGIAWTAAVQGQPAVQPAVQPAGLQQVWTVGEGLRAPESVCLDPVSGLLFLSNIGDGGGATKDGDGWIAKLSADGRVLQNHWVTGLDAPKGLRTFEGTLYISDIDRVVAVDVATGKISRVVAIPEAKFLNDLACGADGTVYVSDLAASRIWMVRGEAATVFAEGPQLEHPNGLLVDGEHLIVGGWGRELQADFSTREAGRLLKISLRTREVSAVTPNPTGHLDGIERDGAGGYLVTDWMDGRLLQIAADGRVRVVQQFAKGLADHAVLNEQRLLILPQMMDNRLTAFRWPVAGSR